MNNKILVFTSFLIALLCHLIFFNLFTFVFSIDPVTPKPKFFFLGPILSQNDFKQIAPKKQNPIPHKLFKNYITTSNDLKHINSGPTDQTENPFDIRTIKKPLLPQTTESQSKIIIKSTFETHLKEDAHKEPETQRVDPVLNIKPYRPLKSWSP